MEPQRCVKFLLKGPREAAQFGKYDFEVNAERGNVRRMCLFLRLSCLFLCSHVIVLTGRKALALALC